MEGPKISECSVHLERKGEMTKSTSWRISTVREWSERGFLLCPLGALKCKKKRRDKMMRTGTI